MSNPTPTARTTRKAAFPANTQRLGKLTAREQALATKAKQRKRLALDVTLDEYERLLGIAEGQGEPLSVILRAAIVAGTRAIESQGLDYSPGRPLLRAEPTGKAFPQPAPQPVWQPSPAIHTTPFPAISADNEFEPFVRPRNPLTSPSSPFKMPPASSVFAPSHNPSPQDDGDYEVDEIAFGPE